MLSQTDPELFHLISSEAGRQRRTVNLIASENYVSQNVAECLSSCLNNKYAEGQPGLRYYSGTKYVDQVEMLAKTRALELFDLSPITWDVNVQAYSGAVANLAILTALVAPGETIMGLHLKHGGHLSHGYRNGESRVSATSLFWNSHQYKICRDSGDFDYNDIATEALKITPKLIFIGASSLPCIFDVVKFSDIAKSVGAYLVFDISHYCGLMVAGLLPSPFLENRVDIVMSTLHKNLRGPRSAVIFYKKHLKNVIDNAVFPKLQGGPHMHTIAGIAACLKNCKSKDFVEYQCRVVMNARIFSNELISKGLEIRFLPCVSNFILIDVSQTSITADIFEKCFEFCSLTLNRNVLNDSDTPMRPSGLRVGFSAITTLNYTGEQVATLASIFYRIYQVVVEKYNKSSTSLDNIFNSLNTLKKEVEDLACFGNCTTIAHETHDFQ